ncbi:5'-deoxynucleotidase HDDC2 isoform X3 [Pyxicephalus adspersus]|uniref:5'-deoxynucleotidase HDDC2 isoform X3 n=1 Tax=Pyxicephalus adspersus TaxID=30357 RepID=UPI003B59D8AE
MTATSQVSLRRLGFESVMAAASCASAAGRNLLQFMKLLGQLKRTPRTGWVYRQVEKPESVSDHMYRMAVIAMLTADNKLNKDRCIRLALVHDMAESIVGDIAPADNVSKEEKHRKEKVFDQVGSGLEATLDSCYRLPVRLGHTLTHGGLFCLSNHCWELFLDYIFFFSSGNYRNISLG